jgi:uncharacterized protein
MFYRQMDVAMYEPRTYRQHIIAKGLVSFTAIVRETDLFIRAETDLSREAIDAIREFREPLEQYIRAHPLFMHSLEPLDVAPGEAEIIRLMAESSKSVNVGPMAAVAGAMSEMVGKRLLDCTSEIIVENGGDIFIKTKSIRHIGIYAGESVLSNKLAIEIHPEQTPAGICTSSGTVGPSLSLGMADAVVVISHSAALADAAATAVGNLIKSAEDIDPALDYGCSIAGICGLILISGEKLGVWGDIKLVPLQ